MATYLKDINGGDYSVLEANFLAARRTGQVKAQLPLGDTDFSDGEAAENGMFLIYDVVNEEVKLPTSADDTGMLLHFSVEKEYDNVRPGLNRYAIFQDETPYPRLFQPHLGDTFTTDAVRLGDSDISDASALIAYNALTPGTEFAIGTDGFIDATADDSIATGVKVTLVSLTTLPDGGYACKFQVTNVA